MSLQSNPHGRCRLLEPLAELQLYIYEFAVVEAQPIRINLPQDWYTISTRRTNRLPTSDQLTREAVFPHWKNLLARNRQQPPLARTCKAVRQDQTCP